MPAILNSRRLRAYPRLFLLATWSIVVANIVMRQGWLGGLGQIIGIDFIVLYAAGKLYVANVTHLYDFAAQLALQQQLISPTVLPGSGPYSNPPYVAAVYALLTCFPLSVAFVMWSGFTIAVTGIASHLAHRFVMPKRLLDAGLTRGALFTILLSSFAFVEGFQAGQNHGLTLLLVTAICAASFSGRWLLAGTLGGLLIYKPQFVLGFLLIWLIWRRWKALTAFALVSALWVGSVLVSRGLQPFADYLGFSGQILALPYIQGWPGYLLVTPFGLLATALPSSAFPVALWVSRGLGAIMTMFLALFAYRVRKRPSETQHLALAMALLFPLIATPYVLLHDLLLLVPGFLLLAWDRLQAQRILYLAVAAYVGTLVAPVIGAALHLALPSLIPLGVLWLVSRQALVVMRSVHE